MKPAALVALFCCLGLLLVEDSTADATKKSAPTLQQKRIARGNYLVTIAGCDDCHTPKKMGEGPPKPDFSLRLSGRPATTPAPSAPNPGEATLSLDLTAWHGPWGVSYTTNLTPDKETGIGRRYTEASFIKTLRTGKKPEGEPLLPPMPWEQIGQMTDEDLKSVYAYLKSIKPVRNYVRQAAPAAAQPR